MNENIKKNEDKVQDLKLEENKNIPSNLKTTLFISQKKNIPEKDNQYRKRKYNKFISLKKPYFKVDKKPESYKKKYLHDPNINDGRWTEEERDKFLQGITLYGINWRKVKNLIPTRTAVQVRSHAQKFYQRMKLCKDKNLGIDFTLNSIYNVKDMINQIKSKYPNYNIFFILKKLSYGCFNRRFSKKMKKIKNYRYNIYNNNTSKNDNKELINENNNYINNNIILNQNNMKFLENNKYNKTINDNYNNNCEHNNNNEFKTVNILDNDIINNNSSILPNLSNILNNSLNINLNNCVLNNNFFDKLNNNSNPLNNYLDKNYMNDRYIKYLSTINNILLTRIKLFDIINYMDNIYLLNAIKDPNLLDKNPLVNNNNIPIINNNNIFNNNSYINNNIPILNNNNTLINNYIPTINDNNPLIKNNLPIINNNNPLINNDILNTPQIQNDISLIINKSQNNDKKENDILIEINENEKKK